MTMNKPKNKSPCNVTRGKLYETIQIINKNKRKITESAILVITIGYVQPPTRYLESIPFANFSHTFVLLFPKQSSSE